MDNRLDPEAFEKIYKGHEFERIRSPKAKDASLLIPLVETENGETAVLFEIRSRNIRQGGEVCFPGGRVDKGEAPSDTAVREVTEELSIKKEQIKLICPMFTMNGVGDAFIYVYLGRLLDYTGSFSKSEVGSVFTLTISELLAMEPKVNSASYVIDLPEDFHFELIPGGRDYVWRNRPKNYYFYETPYGVIWGMTGELLYNFIENVRRVTECHPR
ncbi:MAG: NUDIX domain-containing protein [Eubacteriales bacterium]|nr:NUDIX domain-containing protein [Eubacteriales bacterium]